MVESRLNQVYPNDRTVCIPNAFSELRARIFAKMPVRVSAGDRPEEFRTGHQSCLAQNGLPRTLESGDPSHP